MARILAMHYKSDFPLMHGKRIQRAVPDAVAIAMTSRSDKHNFINEIALQSTSIFVYLIGRYLIGRRTLVIDQDQLRLESACWSAHFLACLMSGTHPPMK